MSREEKEKINCRRFRTYGKPGRNTFSAQRTRSQSEEDLARVFRRVNNRTINFLKGVTLQAALGILAVIPAQCILIRTGMSPMA